MNKNSSSSCRCKNAEESEKFRLQGNKCFQLKDDQSALYWYNRSICSAPSSSASPLLALALANRSAVLLKLQEFQVNLTYWNIIKKKLDNIYCTCILTFYVYIYAMLPVHLPDKYK